MSDPLDRRRTNVECLIFQRVSAKHTKSDGLMTFLERLCKRTPATGCTFE